MTNRTLAAPRVSKLWPVCAMAILTAALLAAQQGEAPLRVLDLTGPLLPPTGTFRIPGDRFGWAPGLKPDPKYPLPLEVTIRSLEPRTVTLGQKFIVELLLRNTGPEPYYLPIARNDGTVHEQGKLRRRQIGIDFRFQDSASGRPIRKVMEAMAGSDSVPESLLPLRPQETILIRFFADSRFLDLKNLSGPAELEFAVVLSEWTSEDDRYFVKARSADVESKNRLAITVLPK